MVWFISVCVYITFSGPPLTDKLAWRTHDNRTGAHDEFSRCEAKMSTPFIGGLLHEIVAEKTGPPDSFLYDGRLYSAVRAGSNIPKTCE